jgi:hypothetical protein
VDGRQENIGGVKSRGSDVSYQESENRRTGRR